MFRSLLRARAWPLWLALFEAALALFGALAGRAPRGHDGLTYFGLQWFFLSGASSGEIPQWIPYVTHGTPAGFWYLLQGSTLQPALLLFGRWLPENSFLFLFWSGVFVEHLLLIGGLWLLSLRLYRSPWAGFAVAAAVLGSPAWLSQPWLNLHVCAAFPLLLELLLRWLDDARARWLAALVALLGYQAVGAAIYVLPVLTFLLALHVGAMLVTRELHVRAFLRTLRWGPTVVALVAGLVPLALVYVVAKAGMEGRGGHPPDRAADHTVTLGTFLAYGSFRPFELHWSEALVRASWELDHSLYAGALMPGLVAVALLRPNAAVIRFGVWTLLLTAFCGGTLLALVAWLGFPGMRVVRHLGGASSLVRIAACLLAGYGVDGLLTECREGARKVAARRLLLALGGTLGLLLLAENQWELDRCLVFFRTMSLDAWSRLGATVHQGLLETAGICAVGALGAFALYRFPARTGVVLTGLLVLHTADVLVFRAGETVSGTVRLDDAQRESLRFGSFPFPMRRSDQAGERERHWATLATKVDETETRYGVLQAIFDAFLLHDGLASQYRMDLRPRSFDDLVQACAGLPLQAVNRTRVADGALSLSLQRCPTVSAVAGGERDKVRVFRGAEWLADDAVALALLDSDAGDRLRLTATDARVVPAAERSAPADIPARVVAFSANALDLSVDVPADEAEHWLYLAEGWHPGWQARVDGEPARVEKANLAFRAVALPRGTKRVSFLFRQPGLHAAYVALGLASMACTSVAIGLLIAVATRLRERT